MMKSRVAGIMDVARLAMAVRTPGIDPRPWVSLASVMAVGKIDDESPVVDVMLMPLRQRFPARVGSLYAGPGYGFYAPIFVDDEVLVEAPNGDPSHGLVVTARLFSASDPPPQAAVDHPTDILLVTKKDASIRIVPQGEGKVVLGDVDASQAPAFNDDLAAIVDILAHWVVVPDDGGAALQAAITLYLHDHPGFPIGATKVVIK